MGYITKRSDGSLHKNDDKKADNHPDLTGRISIDREQLRLLNQMMERSSDGEVKPKLAAWHRRSKSDNKPYFYIRLESSMKDDDEPKQTGYTPPAQSHDDDIPF